MDKIINYLNTDKALETGVYNVIHIEQISEIIEQDVRRYPRFINIDSEVFSL